MRSSRLVTLFVWVGLGLLSTSRASAQTDRLARAYLGISSIEARFLPPEGQKYCCLAIAKFTQGEFVGYADLTIPVDSFVPQKHYQAELGWARKEGRPGFFMTTEGALRPSTVFGRMIFLPISTTHSTWHVTGFLNKSLAHFTYLVTRMMAGRPKSSKTRS